MKHLSKGSVMAVFFIVSLVYAARPCYSDVPLESNPRSIAINPITSVAVITDEKADSVSIVDMNSEKIISTIPVGKAPKGVAIDNGLNVAAVTNSKDDTISLVDLNRYSVTATIPVGKEPEGVAVDQSSHQAFVVNHKDNAVSVIDLVNCRVIRIIPVGQEPIDVAIDSGQDIALVVNEKDYDISVIDLHNYEVTGTVYEVTGTVSVGQKPQAIDVNSEMHMAAVADEKDNAITIIDIQTGQTSSIQTCKHPVDVLINPLDNRALVVCAEDRSLLLIDLSTQATVQSYALNKLPKGVAGNNFTNVAAVSDDQTDSLTLIQLPNPVPVITALTPPQVYRGGAEETISVEGTGFIRTSAVNFGNSSLTTTFIDNHHVKASVRGDLLNEAWSVPICVENPRPMGGSSNSFNLEVVNPVPSISALDPMEATAGSSSLTMNLYGTGFFEDTALYVNGVSRPFSLLSRSKVQTELASSDLEEGAYLEITAANPQPGGGFSNKTDLIVLNPVPILTSISPVAVVAGSAEFTLTLTGDNFVKTSAISFNSQQYPIRYISKTRIETTIPADAVKIAGTYSINVINPLPGGGESIPSIFTVKPALEIAVTSPADRGSVNGAVTIVRGTFRSDTNDVGILVDGKPAEITGREWVANGVPLTTGTNTLTATITDGLGNASSASIDVITSDTAQPVRLIPNITSGIAPLTCYFSVSADMPPVTYQMDFNGDGVTDYSGTSFDDMSYTYTTEGLFYPTITVTDNQGNTYSDTIAITVLNKAEIEAVLKGKWEGIKAALASGDIEKAVGFFAEDKKDMYRYNFTLMASLLPTMIKDMGDIHLVRISDDVAECEMTAVQDGIEYSFYVEFVKDVNGLWKLRFF